MSVKLSTAEIINMVIVALKIAVKEGPEIYEAVQNFLEKLRKKEFTEAELLALKIDKSPEEFFAELEP